jgi:hypothetical protein
LVALSITLNREENPMNPSGMVHQFHGMQYRRGQEEVRSKVDLLWHLNKLRGLVFIRVDETGTEEIGAVSVGRNIGSNVVLFRPYARGQELLFWIEQNPETTSSDAPLRTSGADPRLFWLFNAIELGKVPSS